MILPVIGFDSIIATIALIFSALSLYHCKKSNSAIIEDSINTKIDNKDNQIRQCREKIKMLRLLPNVQEREEQIAIQIEFLECELQSLCNIFNVACGFYLDGKIDKKRFKREYLQEIIELVEADYNKGILSDKNAYSSLLTVYSKFKK